jgi:hypothetical protein
MAKDFLSGLIDRAFDRAPVLQKRKPSLFEPVDLTRGEWSDIAIEAPPAHAVSPAERSLPEPPRLARSRGDVALPPAVEAPRAERGSQTEPAKRGPDDRAALRSPSTDPPPIPRETRTVERVVERLAPERIVERHTHTEEKTIEHREIHMERSGRAQRLEGPLTKRGRPVPAVPRPAPVLEKQRPAVIATPARPLPQPQRPATPAAPHRASAVRTTPAPVAASPEPAIHVTIGRIELRAAAPPQAPRPVASRPRPPRLNLGAYLKERGGGNR